MVLLHSRLKLTLHPILSSDYKLQNVKALTKILVSKRVIVERQGRMD